MRPVKLGLWDAPRFCWVRWNSQHNKNCVSLPSCRKPKNQEGNKSFVSELKKVVSVFRDSYASEHFMYSYNAYVYITFVENISKSKVVSL